MSAYNCFASQLQVKWWFWELEVSFTVFIEHFFVKDMVSCLVMSQTIDPSSSVLSTQTWSISPGFLKRMFYVPSRRNWELDLRSSALKNLVSQWMRVSPKVLVFWSWLGKRVDQVVMVYAKSYPLICKPPHLFHSSFTKLRSWCRSKKTLCRSGSLWTYKRRWFSPFPNGSESGSRHST